MNNDKDSLAYAFKIRVGVLVIEAIQQYADSGAADVALFARQLASEMVEGAAHLKQEHGGTAADFRHWADDVATKVWGE